VYRAFFSCTFAEVIPQFDLNQEEYLNAALISFLITFVSFKLKEKASLTFCFQQHQNQNNKIQWTKFTCKPCSLSDFSPITFSEQAQVLFHIIYLSVPRAKAAFFVLSLIAEFLIPFHFIARGLRGRTNFVPAQPRGTENKDYPLHCVTVHSSQPALVYAE